MKGIKQVLGLEINLLFSTKTLPAPSSRANVQQEWWKFDASRWGGRYSEHIQLLVGRFLEQIGEQRRRQVALTERRNHHRDNLTRIH